MPLYPCIQDEMVGHRAHDTGKHDSVVLHACHVPPLIAANAEVIQWDLMAAHKEDEQR